ncbi:MAG: potassium channel protein [Nitrospirae bacterium]|nr:potassium channel protein [Nitrospirota bacterium]
MKDERISGFYRRFFGGVIILSVILVSGTTGYRLIGGSQYSMLDCFYMTFITISTIGYGEIIDMTYSPEGRVFTMFVAFFGIGVLTYLLSNFTAFVVGGELKEAFWRKRMENKIKTFSNHYIVCGLEGDGFYIVHELYATSRPCIVVEIEKRRIERALEMFHALPFIEGDASDNDILLSAGIERAKGLFAAAGEDNLNLVVTLSAKQLNPDIKVVTRCKEIKNVNKMKKAGADVVVSPNYIGGLRMASEMFRPTVVSFLDTMLRDKERNLRIEEVVIPDDVDPKPISALHLKRFPTCMLLAVKTRSGAWVYNPSEHQVINPSDTLVFMSTPGERIDMKKIFHLKEPS